MPPREQRQIIQIDRLAMDYHDDMGPIIALNQEQFRQEATVAGIIVPQNVGGGGQIGRGGFSDMQNYNRGMRGAGMRMPSGAAAAAATGPKERGFIVEIICTTPNAGGASFVLDRFVSKLKTLTSSNSDVKYQIDKVDAPSSMLLRNDPTLASQAGNMGGVRYTPTPYATPYDGQRGGLYGGRMPVPQSVPPGVPAVPGVPPVFDPLKDTVTGEDMGNDTRVTVRMSVIIDPPPAAPANNTAGPVAQAGNP